jgi:hypothetical protein
MYTLKVPPYVGKVNMEHQLDATVTVLLIFKISSTCFGQDFVHLQERKTVIVASIWCSIFTLPTLMMHGQTQIKFTSIWLTLAWRWFCKYRNM